MLGVDLQLGQKMLALHPPQLHVKGQLATGEKQLRIKVRLATKKKRWAHLHVE